MKFEEFFIDNLVIWKTLSQNSVLFSPDPIKGKRISKLVEKTNNGIIHGIKSWGDEQNKETRNVQIAHFKLENIIFDNKKILILDDFCNSGELFVSFSIKLQELGICKSNINLYVTYGVFSQGLDKLKPYINHIYCYYSFLPIEEKDNNFITILGSTFIE